MHFFKAPHEAEASYLFLPSRSDSPRGRPRLSGGSQASLSSSPRLHFPPRSLCFRRVILPPCSCQHSVFLAVLVLPPPRPAPPRLTSSTSLPLTLPSLCLTTVGLLWEVIRKNSAETHTAAAAESKAFNPFYSRALHYNSKRLGVGGRRWRLPLHLQGVVSWGKRCFGKPGFYVARYPTRSFCSYLCHSGAKGAV